MIQATVEEVVEIDGLMGPVKVADTDMKDARAKGCPSIARPLDGAGQGCKDITAQAHGHVFSVRLFGVKTGANKASFADARQ
jgi:hypothetical protein